MDKIQEVQISIAALEQMLENNDMSPDELHDALAKLDELVSELQALGISELDNISQNEITDLL